MKQEKNIVCFASPWINQLLNNEPHRRVTLIGRNNHYTHECTDTKYSYYSNIHIAVGDSDTDFLTVFSLRNNIQ